ncbi:hypothetical protein RJT34_24709 [Clitoria ternatea]|uniref:Uncharacterized protein n=1 Tax=Clitoria ternatea TaxID=43366 RepID=A0AAN9IG60_CLITE
MRVESALDTCVFDSMQNNDFFKALQNGPASQLKNLDPNPSSMSCERQEHKLLYHQCLYVLTLICYLSQKQGKATRDPDDEKKRQQVLGFKETHENGWDYVTLGLVNAEKILDNSRVVNDFKAHVKGKKREKNPYPLMRSLHF